VLRADDLDHWLERVEPGRPASVFTDDVADTRNALQEIAESETEPARVVTLSWQRVPALGNELGLLVTALAKATVALYPSLYGLMQTTRERWEESDACCRGRHSSVAEGTRTVLWVRGAGAAVREGRRDAGDGEPEFQWIRIVDRAHLGPLIATLPERGWGQVKAALLEGLGL
jgi:hypothetical protein